MSPFLDQDGKEFTPDWYTRWFRVKRWFWVCVWRLSRGRWGD